MIFLVCAMSTHRQTACLMISVSSKHSAVHGLGVASNLTAKVFQLERPSWFWVLQINDKKARKQERKLSPGSMHWHHVLSEPRHSFTSPESWTPWDWQLPLNWALSLLSEMHMARTSGISTFESHGLGFNSTVCHSFAGFLQHGAMQRG